MKRAQGQEVQEVLWKQREGKTGKQGCCGDQSGQEVRRRGSAIGTPSAMCCRTTPSRCKPPVLGQAMGRKRPEVFRPHTDRPS